MDARMSPETGTLELQAGSLDEARDFLDQAVRDGGFMVSLDRELPVLEPLDVRLSAGVGFELRFAARVVQRFDTATARYGTAFELLDWGESQERELERQLGASRQGQPEAPAGGGPEPDPEDTTEMRGSSPIHRIRALNPSQRARLATRADRTERQILLRDNSAQVLQSLLVNPRLDRREVLRLVKSTHVTGAILKRVIEDGRWSKNPEILAQVARNPKTPSPIAVRLMGELRTSDLRWMAKMSSGLRENIRRAALREYLQRTGGA